MPRRVLPSNRTMRRDSLPVRERPADQVRTMVSEGLRRTGYDEVALTSLSTADFSGVRDTRSGRLEDGGPNDWVVIGYVDAQNGFGAMIRSNYQVVIEFEEGRSDSYRIKSANLLER